MGRAWSTGLLLLVFVGGVLLGRRPDPPVVQPIRFSHKKHTSAGLDCVICHPTVQEEAFAGLPPLETCMLCHSSPVTQSAEEEKLRALAAKGEPLVWQRLYRLPNNIWFSHRRHAGVAEIGCPVCHGPMGEAAAPPPKPLVSQRMEWCVECHIQRGANADCNACHR